MASLAKSRLHARPGAHTLKEARKGLRRLELSGQRDGLLYVPDCHGNKSKAPLIVMLHGAGGHAHHSFVLMQDLADHTGAILLAPESRGVTWDVIRSDFGEDVAFIDEALKLVFAEYEVDPKHIALAGFSDGASYALSLGVSNGELFSHIIAFSPGFISATDFKRSPPVFISHGILDQVLPIQVCSRKLAPLLRQAGLSVEYVEFGEGHTVPAHIAKGAMTWFLGEQATANVNQSSVSAEEAQITQT